MTESSIQVLDFTLLPEPSDTVVLVRFEHLNGTVHVYRDGTVVMTTLAGSSVSRLTSTGDAVWRKEMFLTLLARMGGSSTDLIHAAQVADSRESELGKLGFAQAAQQAAAEATTRFKAWCAQHELPEDSLDEAAVDQLLVTELARIRKTTSFSLVPLQVVQNILCPRIMI